jgi:hypothetical protein
MKKTTRLLLCLLAAACVPAQAGLFDAINPIRIFQRAPERFVPEFHREVFIIAPYQADGRTPVQVQFPLDYDQILRNNIQRGHPRYFATIETAQHIAKLFRGEVISQVYTLFPFRVLDRRGEPVMQHSVRFEGKVTMPAGLLAWYFSVRPAGADPSDNEAGYWDNSTDPDTVYKAGKSIAERYIRDTLMFAE